MRHSLRSRAVLTAAVFVGVAITSTWLGVAAAQQTTPALARERAERDGGRAERMLVRSGDRVTVTVTIGSVHAYGSGIASGSGQMGDSIRVLPTEGRRALTARITGPGTVEIRP